jgi:hypothetical protein
MILQIYLRESGFKFKSYLSIILEYVLCDMDCTYFLRCSFQISDYLAIIPDRYSALICCTYNSIFLAGGGVMMLLAS